MSKPKVFVTRHIPEVGLQMLRKRFDVEVRTAKAPISRQELLRKIKGKDALLPLLTLDRQWSRSIQARTDGTRLRNTLGGFLHKRA